MEASAVRLSRKKELGRQWRRDGRNNLLLTYQVIALETVGSKERTLNYVGSGYATVKGGGTDNE